MCVKSNPAAELFPRPNKLLLPYQVVYWPDDDEDYFPLKEYHRLHVSDVYSHIVFNRTADEVTTFEEQRSRSAFTPAWILKITWDHVMPVSYQTINDSEVKRWFNSAKIKYKNKENIYNMCHNWNQTVDPEHLETSWTIHLLLADRLQQYMWF